MSTPPKTFRERFVFGRVSQVGRKYIAAEEDCKTLPENFRIVLV